MPLPKSLEWVVEEDGEKRQAERGEEGPKPSAQHDEWAHYLVMAFAKMPQDLAAKLISCIPKEVAVKMLEGVSDPYVKFALLLLTRQ